MRKYAKKYYNGIRNIERYYEYLVTIANNHRFVGIVNEWIIDNYYRLVELERDMKEFLSSRKRYKAAFEGVDLYGILSKTLSQSNYKLSISDMIKSLNTYQDNYNYHFSYETISNIRWVVFLIVISEMSDICDRELVKLDDIKEAEFLLSQIEDDDKNNNLFSISDYINLKNEYLSHPTYLEKLYSGLKELGNSSNDIYEKLVETLEKQKINLEKTFEVVYEDSAKESVLIGNLIHTIIEISKIKDETLFTKLSITEKMLNMDEYYEKMTLESKALYRKNIFKNAKKLHMKEYEYVRNVIMEATKNNQHVGFYIIKKPNTKLRTTCYLSYITLVTLFLSLLLSNLLFKPIWLSFILLLIPISEIVIQLSNWLLLKMVKPKSLPKLDYQSGVPATSATMITITTIVKNKEKVEKMFEKLEIYYLANQSDNLYFALLGDCSSYKEENAPFDQEIIDSGLYYADKLNKKYGKDIFHFVYRRRKYSEGEGTYLGYERKRGALEHFNQLLLGKASKKEINSNFQVTTLSDFKSKIKYVITLDTDTELALGTAFKLIGAMDHPLNQPIIDETKNIVVEGYGLMQPKVSVDVESTNESFFTQVYAGIGGFDVYSSVIPNFYQDLFKEGSFVGKGIYNLDVFDKVLTKRFPENLILSHDLLEGNYVKCGFLSDVELIDDFPSSFLVDASRRHRWARGDTQIIGWLGGNNPLSPLHKFKIFDNIRRNFLDLSLLILIFLSFMISTTNPIIWLALVMLVIMLPVLFFIMEKLKVQKERSTKTKQYINIIVGFRAMVIRIVSVFSSIPYNTKLYLDATFRSLYRMFHSKKNLLNWITAEEASKTVKSDLYSYIVNFRVNYIVSAILVIITICFRTEYIVPVLIIALSFILSPVIFYFMGRKIEDDILGMSTLNEKEEKDMHELAKVTWKFFKDLLTEENNYLIPDNYQINRSYKSDFKTSPTNIGFSLLAIISAKELGFISIKQAISLIEKVINTIKELDKWNGHLYNWYNIETKKPMYPYVISTVDSGNFVSALIVVKEFLNKHNEYLLASDISKIVDNTDFKKLYKNSTNVFSCCYNTLEEQLVPYSYDKFASESRLTSFVAIAKGDVPSKHWFSLDKTLTKFHQYKGLLSWSGTSFEYYMPLIFMKDYKNTLLDESYYFSYYCQKEYMNEINPRLPWGISESAYNELDDSKNYKYQAFGTPYLKFRDSVQERVVIAPYASLMALPKYPKEVYQNYQKMKKINLIGEYGLYESYEVEDKTPIYSFFSHHQGMILTSITNYLKDDIIKSYFYNDIRIQAVDILNKEKVQLKPMINFKINKYKKYSYDKEILVNDVRCYNGIMKNPEISVLSNSNYTVLLNDRGNGFSRFQTIQLNRYRKITEQDYGMYVYFKDLKKNTIWSNTYAPTYKKPNHYEVMLATDEIKYVRNDKDIATTTEITVTKEYNAEIRKITLRNTSNEIKNIEVTSYMEPIICDNSDDISHRVFNNMFIKSSYDADTNSIIVERKKRTNNESYYMVNKLWCENPLEDYTYETERENFLARNDEYSNPSGLNNELTNYVGDNLEPIISIRNRVKLIPNGKTVMYLINGFGTSKKQVLDIVNAYNTKYAIDSAFRISTIMICKNIKRLGVETSDINLYNKALNYLYQTTKIHLTEERRNYLLNNELGQSSLWRFSVSGDRPIILVELNNASSLGLAKEIIKMFEYYKTRGIFVDIVIINSDNPNHKETIKKAVSNELHCMYAMNDFQNTPGSVTLIERDDITDEELNLFRSIARLKFDSNYNSSLKDHIETLQIINNKEVLENSKLDSEKIVFENITFDNGIGGFSNDGTEYIINNPNTPRPWSNVLCNSEFGTVVTNNNNGFTYADNSREFKITSWTNDVILNDQSEGFRINKQLINWYSCRHGFGYTNLYFHNKQYKVELTYFVPQTMNAKIAIMNITSNTTGQLNLEYWINPVLGTTEEKTARHIVETFDKKDNILVLENRYISVYKNKHIYMTASEPIDKITSDAIIRSFNVKLDFTAKESKKIVFVLGCEDNINKICNNLKHFTPSKAEKLYDDTVKYWRNEIGGIEVKTNDKSFDYMINGWLPYQTIASRIMAKTAFYQVGGAFGFRDQLQDCINMCILDPSLVHAQIINCARHQFMEGDVLHWWHEQNKFGLRSRFKDDYLWLIYAVSEYIKITGDNSILKEKVNFVSAPNLKEYEEERGMEFTYTSVTAPIYDHLTLCITKAMRELGSNGLPLMGGGDWNDGMNHIGIKGNGTSVWLAFFLYDIVNRYIEITKIYNRRIDTKVYQEFNETLRKNVIKTSWDGKYFVRAFNDNGVKIGSKDSMECKIDLISQSFAILTGIATDAQIESIISEVDEKLVDKKGNFIKLLSPAFTDKWIDPGYIKNYPKGIRENGGQYTHACSWYIMALIKIGLYDKAYEYYHMINPINHSLDKKGVLEYKVEPYVIAADIYSNKEFYAQGGWTWYTGSSGWFYRVGIEEILGIKKRKDKLLIEPHLPSSMKECTVIYKYMDTKYKITICSGVKYEINLVNDKKDHKIDMRSK